MTQDEMMRKIGAYGNCVKGVYGDGVMLTKQQWFRNGQAILSDIETEINGLYQDRKQLLKLKMLLVMEKLNRVNIELAKTMTFRAF